MFLINPGRSNSPTMQRENSSTADLLKVQRAVLGDVATPLVSLGTLAREIGVAAVYVKDESKRSDLKSYKILGASWAAYRALQDTVGFASDDWNELPELVEILSKSGQDDLELVAATDGNHGLAVARMAALLHLRCSIYVPGGTTQSRIASIESEGARVVETRGTYDEAVSMVTSLASDRCLVISDTSSDPSDKRAERVVEGYMTLLEEVAHQLGSLGSPPPSVVMVPTGVGSLATAAVRSRSTFESPELYVVTVEPDDAACVLESLEAGTPKLVPGPHLSSMAGLNCGLPTLATWPELQSGIDACLTVADGESADAMRFLWEHGVESGESGAASLAGLLRMASMPVSESNWTRRLSDSDVILLLSTEGATDRRSFDRIVGQSEWTSPRV